jgi:hypothetical protein
MKRVILSIAVVLLLLAPGAGARTWYINTAGTGDAPTIAAGVDSAVAGDTVLVAAGTYEVKEVDVKPGLVVTSESGPTLTHIVQPPEYTYYGLSCRDYPWGSPSSEVSGFWFEGYQYPLGALNVYGSFTNATIRYNVFAGNNEGLVALGQASAYVENCTFIGNGVCGLNALDGDVQLWYSIMWDHQYGSIYGLLVDYLDLTDASGNSGGVFFSLDPQFCGESVGNYFLQSDSPCAPGSPETPQLMGALPVGCGEVRTEARSWGKIKAMYRE